LRQIASAHRGRHPTWHVARWDYWVTHGITNIERQDLREVVWLWETPSGRIAALVNPEGAGEAFFHVRQAPSPSRLLEEMLEVAERSLARVEGGRASLRIWIPERDGEAGQVLARSGYVVDGTPEDSRCRDLTAPIPEARPPAGYRIRPLRDGDDFPARGELSQHVFHPVPDGSTAMTREEYLAVQRGPLYRRDLDLVAEGPGGELVGFATVWFDDSTRTGLFEPVGVAARHRRRGIGRALLLEGMRLLRWYGADLAFVGSFGTDVGGFYASAGLVPYERLVPWMRAG
jgi:ribosomal protein S18 acetylase RimI-like enzyme